MGQLIRDLQYAWRGLMRSGCHPFRHSSENDGFWVQRLALQQNGGVLVQGSFDRAFQADIERLGLARFNPDGTLDIGFNPVASGLDWDRNQGAPWGITSMWVNTNDDILLAGSFTTNGVPQNRIARLKGDGSPDPTFTPASGLDLPLGFTPGFGLDVPLETILQADGRIIVFGKLTNVAGVKRVGLARLHADGTLDTSFDPGEGPDGGSGSVTSVAVRPDGEIVTAGEFSTFDNIARNRIALLYAENPIPRLMILSRGDAAFHFLIPTLNGKSYQIETNDSLGVSNWGTLQGFTGDGNAKEIDQSTTSSHRFYRVRIQ
jgi:uncharacterized delta-60 repeat protein